MRLGAPAWAGWQRSAASAPSSVSSATSTPAQSTPSRLDETLAKALLEQSRISEASLQELKEMKSGQTTNRPSLYTYRIPAHFPILDDNGIYCTKEWNGK